MAGSDALLCMDAERAVLRFGLDLNAAGPPGSWQARGRSVAGCSMILAVSTFLVKQAVLSDEVCVYEPYSTLDLPSLCSPLHEELSTSSTQRVMTCADRHTSAECGTPRA